MEKERRFLNHSELLFQKVKERGALWLELISSADIDEETKEKLTSAITDLTENGTLHWNTVSDALYGTIHKMYSIVEHAPKDSEATSLFENLRDDIWEMKKEAEEEY